MAVSGGGKGGTGAGEGARTRRRRLSGRRRDANTTQSVAMKENSGRTGNGGDRFPVQWRTEKISQRRREGKREARGRGGLPEPANPGLPRSIIDCARWPRTSTYIIAVACPSSEGLRSAPRASTSTSTSPHPPPFSHSHSHSDAAPRRLAPACNSSPLAGGTHQRRRTPTAITQAPPWQPQQAAQTLFSRRIPRSTDPRPRHAAGGPLTVVSPRRMAKCQECDVRLCVSAWARQGQLWLLPRGFTARPGRQAVASTSERSSSTTHPNTGSPCP